jgi:superoxide dismutase, Fe-Mn family
VGYLYDKYSMSLKKYLDIVTLAEGKKDLPKQIKLPYAMGGLSPSISKKSLDDHYNGLASRYFERYRKGEGDQDFNYGGAVLHNLFFGNLTPAKSSNPPEGAIKSIIEEKYGSFKKFQDAVEKTAMGIQGSGWIYIDSRGEIKTIKNHEYRDTMQIVLLIDWWEHAWFTDYGPDKAQYLKNIWKIIDWSVVNSRLDS